jgi:hypothetical protein
MREIQGIVKLGFPYFTLTTLSKIRYSVFYI